jgi:hypothetical protein
MQIIARVSSSFIARQKEAVLKRFAWVLICFERQRPLVNGIVYKYSNSQRGENKTFTWQRKQAVY